MRFREFMPEDYLKIKEEGDEGSESGNDMAANIASVLQIVKRQSEEKNSAPVINTQSFIQLVQNTGYKNFGYADLVAANEIPAVQNLIKSFNKDEVVLKVDGEQGEENSDEYDNNAHKPDPETTVDSMAKRALNR